MSCTAPPDFDIRDDDRLLSKEAVKKRLGISDAAFAELRVEYVVLGKRRRYIMADVRKVLNERKQCEGKWSGREKGRRSTGTTLRSAEIGFEEALKQRT